MNPSQKWEKQHWAYAFQELREARIDIARENIPRIIEHMSFRVRSRRNPERCTLYPAGKSCHPEIKDLNCLLCACSDYDNSTQRGACRANSKKGFYYQSIHDKNVQVWDCSNCPRYHSPAEVRDFLEKYMDKLREMSEKREC